MNRFDVRKARFHFRKLQLLRQQQKKKLDIRCAKLVVDRNHFWSFSFLFHSFNVRFDCMGARIIFTRERFCDEHKTHKCSQNVIGCDMDGIVRIDDADCFSADLKFMPSIYNSIGVNLREAVITLATSKMITADYAEWCGSGIQ